MNNEEFLEVIERTKSTLSHIKVGDTLKFKHLNWSQWQDVKIKYIGNSYIVVDKSCMGSDPKEYIIKIDGYSYQLEFEVDNE